MFPFCFAGQPSLLGYANNVVVGHLMTKQSIYQTRFVNLLAALFICLSVVSFFYYTKESRLLFFIGFSYFLLSVVTSKESTFVCVYFPHMKCFSLISTKYFRIKIMLFDFEVGRQLLLIYLLFYLLFYFLFYLLLTNSAVVWLVALFLNAVERRTWKATIKFNVKYWRMDMMNMASD